MEQVSEEQQLNSIFVALGHEDKTLEGYIAYQIISNFIYKMLCLHLSL